jgi:hypothetical protein
MTTKPQTKGNTMNKHTPGPWTLDKKSAISYGWRDGKPIRYEIAECKGSASAEANARLIAASPELLEALKIAQAQIRLYAEYAKEMKKIGRGYEPTAYGYSPEYFDGIMSAAIAKATGGERE